MITAKLDDALNYFPARLAGAFIVAAAMFVPKGLSSQALSVMLRDGGKHRSPNAGWCEAAMAGALGVALAGPRRYGEEVVDDAWMNRDGTPDAEPEDIRKGLRLYLISLSLLWSLIAVGVLIALWQS